MIQIENEQIEVTVTKVIQGNVTAYTGKMKAADILAIYDLKRWSETELDGYQRQLYLDRQKEIADYLKNCTIPIIPAILASIRSDTLFSSSDRRDIGTLKIPKRRGGINLIDGQHRMSGFSYCLEELGRIQEERRLGIETEDQNNTFNKCEEILQYDIPILFFDSKLAAEILDKEKDPESSEIKEVLPNDVERVIFYIVNKTQKGIRPSLKDTLQFLIYRAGIRGIPSIEKESWRVDATEIGHRMNKNGSPLAGKINLSGARGLGRPIQLNSWVSSMQPLFANGEYTLLSRNEKYNIIRTYWNVLRELFEKPFDDNRNHLLLKSIGVYSLNWLATDVYEWITSQGKTMTVENISEYLEPLRDFNWRSKEPNPSEMRGFGGKAGVKEAYKLLLKYLAEKGVEEANTKYTEIIEAEERRSRR